MKNTLFTFILFFISTTGHCQFGSFSTSIEEDTTFTGDIFSDFNEELDAAQVLEDERFYRYGRFFSANFGLGHTGFTGNRGKAYEDFLPSYSLAVVYFFNFQTAFTMGIQYSRHAMYIDTNVNAHSNIDLGTIEVSMLRPFLGMRYYIDTSNLGTAITYANPYLTGRFEYWYQTNKFVNQPSIASQSGGALGIGYGFGLEFPIEFKASYLGVEILYHHVNFFDKFTQDYAQIPDSDTSNYGYDDLTGEAFSVIVTYNVTW